MSGIQSRPSKDFMSAIFVDFSLRSFRFLCLSRLTPSLPKYPLLKKKGRPLSHTLFSNIQYPIFFHGTRLRSAFATHNHPIDVFQVHILKVFHKWFATQESYCRAGNLTETIYAKFGLPSLYRHSKPYIFGQRMRSEIFSHSFRPFRKQLVSVRRGLSKWSS